MTTANMRLNLSYTNGIIDLNINKYYKFEISVMI